MDVHCSLSSNILYTNITPQHVYNVDMNFVAPCSSPVCVNNLSFLLTSCINLYPVSVNTGVFSTNKAEEPFVSVEKVPSTHKHSPGYQDLFLPCSIIELHLIVSESPSLI